MQSASFKTFIVALVLCVLSSITFPVLAQPDYNTQPSEAISDPYGRISPPGTGDGYLKAMREADPAKAALFLDLRGQPETQSLTRATQLKVLLDSGGYFLLTEQISAAPEGNLDDEMSADLEEVGAVRAAGRTLPLILQRISGADDQYIWLFSADTVSQLPELHRLSRNSLLDQLLPETLTRYNF